MNYREAIEYIWSSQKFGMKLGLENIEELLKRLGNPHKGLKIIHIAGTNGKGSTANFISEILIEGGFKVGLYTSPELFKFNDRIRINKEPCSDREIISAVIMVKKEIDEMIEDGLNSPTEFEIATAVGFLIFKKAKVDYLILEVGLGGRLDATNVASPIITVITHIAKDHMEYLGNSLSEIAYEKAGIIKKNVPLILYPQEKEAEDSIREVAKEKNSEIIPVDISGIKIIKNSLEGWEFIFYEKKYKISMLGEHQIKNATTALMAIKKLVEIENLNISQKNISDGIKNAKWEGRYEILSKNPLIIIDGAHNEDGWRVFRETTEKLLPNIKKTIVLGILKDKEIDKALDLILPISDHIITTAPLNERALSKEELAKMVRERGVRATVANSIEDTLDIALRDNNAIFYVGSLYMIGKIREIILRKLPHICD